MLVTYFYTNFNILNFHLKIIYVKCTLVISTKEAKHSNESESCADWTYTSKTIQKSRWDGL